MYIPVRLEGRPVTNALAGAIPMTVVTVVRNVAEYYASFYELTILIFVTCDILNFYSSDVGIILLSSIVFTSLKSRAGNWRNRSDNRISALPKDATPRILPSTAFLQ